MLSPTSAPLATASRANHFQDSDCTPHLVDDECTLCGVVHTAPCSDCGGRGYHADGCASSDATPAATSYGIELLDQDEARAYSQADLRGHLSFTAALKWLHDVWPRRALETEQCGDRMGFYVLDAETEKPIARIYAVEPTYVEVCAAAFAASERDGAVRE